jgi:hypothetical protein
MRSILRALLCAGILFMTSVSVTKADSEGKITRKPVHITLLGETGQRLYDSFA